MIQGTAVAILVKILENEMMVVERVLEKRFHIKVTVIEMKYGFMPAKGPINAVFILRRL